LYYLFPGDKIPIHNHDEGACIVFFEDNDDIADLNLQIYDAKIELYRHLDDKKNLTSKEVYSLSTRLDKLILKCYYGDP